MSTLSGPASEPSPRAGDLLAYAGRVIRIVEGQHRISTNRLTGSLEAQALLEALVEEVKPTLPPAARGLHFLLATPFRYGYGKASRFRRADERPGIFYASERIETAVAEAAFWRMAFFARSPGALLPTTTTEYTSFSVRVEAQAIDLTRPPFAPFEAQWMAEDYEACQLLAAQARAIAAGAIRCKSARDPSGGANIALLDPGGFRESAPRIDESWHLRFVDGRLSALAAFPSRLGFSFEFDQFGLTPP